MSIELLKENILKVYQNDIDLLENKLKKVESDKNLKEFNLYRIEETLTGNVNTIHSSNKSKKELKKYKSELIANFSIKSNLEQDVAILSNVVEDLKNKLLIKSNEYLKMKETINTKNIIELNDIYLNKMNKLKGFNNKNSIILKKNK